MKTNNKIHTTVEAFLNEGKVSPTNKIETYKKDLFEFMTSPETVEELFRRASGDFEAVSKVHTDTDVIKDKSRYKEYKFVGGGFGFVHINVHKGNKLAVELVKYADSIKHLVNNKVIGMFDKSYVRQMEKDGLPLEGVLYQDLRYKLKYAYKVQEFLEYLNIKSSITSHDD